MLFRSSDASKVIPSTRHTFIISNLKICLTTRMEIEYELNLVCVA